MGEPALRSVLVASASPDLMNTNGYLRAYVADGFRAVLPDAAVVVAAYEEAPAIAARLAPDLVVVFGSIMPDECDYYRLADATRKGGGRLVFWLHDDPYEFDTSQRIYAIADAVFTNDRATLPHYPPRLPAFHLPLAGCANTHRRPLGRRSAPDLFFCGQQFSNRLALFQAVAARLPDLRFLVLGNGWEALPAGVNLRVANPLLPDYYATAVAVANVGRNLDLSNRRFQIRASTPGPRTFEAAMAGAAQVFFAEGLEVVEYFEPGVEILVAGSVAEFTDQLDRLRRDPAASLAIGRRAQARAMADHSYAARAATMLRALAA